MYVILSLCIFMILPVSVEAYKVVEKEAFLLDSDTALFFVTYEFGFLNADLLMPIQAIQNSVDANGLNAIYEFKSETGAVVTYDKSYAIVLSEAKLKNDKYYHVPQGEKAQFMLVALIKLSPESNYFDVDSLSMDINSIQFITSQDTRNKTHQLNSSQLSTYKTPSIKI